MPATVTTAPLELACVFSDGRRISFNLSALPNQGLTEDLVRGLSELIHPHGNLDSAGSVRHYLSSARDLVEFLECKGFDGGAPHLRRALLAEYWMGTSNLKESKTRAMLLAFAAAGGVLQPTVEEFARGRNYNPRPSADPLPPYEEREWQRLTEVCRDLVDRSYAAHRRALRDIATDHDPSVEGWSEASIHWLLGRSGPVSTRDFTHALGANPSALRTQGVLAAFYEAIQAVFPHLEVAIELFPSRLSIDVDRW